MKWSFSTATHHAGWEWQLGVRMCQWEGPRASGLPWECWWTRQVLSFTSRYRDGAGILFTPFSTICCFTRTKNVINSHFSGIHLSSLVWRESFENAFFPLIVEFWQLQVWSITLTTDSLVNNKDNWSGSLTWWRWEWCFSMVCRTSYELCMCGVQWQCQSQWDIGTHTMGGSTHNHLT